MMTITIETTIVASMPNVWRAFNNPDDIVQWDASDNWHTTWASNDLRVGGKLLLHIKAKNGSEDFDFAATYSQIKLYQLIEFQEDNGRTVRLKFAETDSGVTIRQTFDAEPGIPHNEQRAEWQAVLDHFARYVEQQCAS